MKGIQELLTMAPDIRGDYLYGLSREEYAEFLKMENSDKINFSRIFTHVHSDLGSPKDAILTNEQYVNTCVDFGTKYLTITDHGTMYDVQYLYDECKKKGLKLVIGCEFYVCDDDVNDNTLKHTRLHLCMYAKNKAGYNALIRLVTEGNYRIITITKKETFPCISRELLMKYIGPGTEGHGNVIVTSACIGGVITGITFEQENTKLNIERLSKKYQKNKNTYDLNLYNTQKIEELEILKDSASDKATANKIDIQLKEFKKGITACKKELNSLNKYNVYSFEELKEYLDMQEQQIESLKNEIIPESCMEEEMTKIAEWYNECVGHGDFYIEVQYHGLSTEQKYEHILCNIAHKLNIPLIAGIDAHMQKKEDARARSYINAIRFEMFNGTEESDKELYLKSDADLYRWLKKAVASDDAIEAILNCSNLYEQCDVVLEKENHYPVYHLSEHEKELISAIPDFF